MKVTCMLFSLVLFSYQVILLFGRKIAPPKLIFADPDDCFIAVCKLFLVNGVRDVRMLLKNSVSVMTVNDQSVPDDDGIDNFSIVDDVLLQLFQFLKSQRRDFALKLRVNFKRIQIRHQTVPS